MNVSPQAKPYGIACKVCLLTQNNTELTRVEDAEQTNEWIPRTVLRLLGTRQLPSLTGTRLAAYIPHMETANKLPGAPESNHVGRRGPVNLHCTTAPAVTLGSRGTRRPPDVTGTSPWAHVPHAKTTSKLRDAPGTDVAGLCSPLYLATPL